MCSSWRHYHPTNSYLKIEYKIMILFFRLICLINYSSIKENSLPNKQNGRKWKRNWWIMELTWIWQTYRNKVWFRLFFYSINRFCSSSRLSYHLECYRNKILSEKMWYKRQYLEFFVKIFHHLLWIINYFL